MLNATSARSGTLDSFRQQATRQAVDAKIKQDEDKRAQDAAEKRNLATEARNYLDDQGKPQTPVLKTVSTAASGGDEQRKKKENKNFKNKEKKLKQIIKKMKKKKRKKKR